MPVPAAVQTLYRDFDNEYKRGGPKCTDLCSTLKTELAKIANPLLLSSQDPEILQLSRDVYEKAAFICIKDKDVQGFERHV